MCFSASASFGAGVILSAIGVLSLKKAKNSNQTAFAAIPLIFAVQQISEGFLWLALSDPYYFPLQQGMTFLFLFFAQVMWPIWVPAALLLLTEKEKRTLIQKALVLIGAVVSGYLAYCLSFYPVTAMDTGMHIMYQQDYPEGPGLYAGFLYIVATILPLVFANQANVDIEPGNFYFLHFYSCFLRRLHRVGLVFFCVYNQYFGTRVALSNERTVSAPNSRSATAKLIYN